jgi:hypothetical protein
LAFLGTLAAACLHMFEEFVYPGRFTNWYKRYKPNVKGSITKRFLILVNAGLLILCYDVCTLGSSQSGIPAWLAVMALLAANAVWHLKGMLITREYSPGVLTGSLIYLPLALYGHIYFLQTNQASIVTAIVAFAVGSSYQMWSNLYHRFRSKSVHHEQVCMPPDQPFNLTVDVRVDFQHLTASR